LEFPCAAADKAQLGIGIESAVLDPAAQKKILARNPKTGQSIEGAIIASFRASALRGLVYFLQSAGAKNISEFLNSAFTLFAIHVCWELYNPTYLLRQLRLQRFIRIQLQHPLACGFVHGRILLCRKPLPRLGENFSSIRTRDL